MNIVKTESSLISSINIINKSHTLYEYLCSLICTIYKLQTLYKLLLRQISDFIRIIIITEHRLTSTFTVTKTITYKVETRYLPKSHIRTKCKDQSPAARFMLYIQQLSCPKCNFRVWPLDSYFQHCNYLVQCQNEHNKNTRKSKGSLQMRIHKHTQEKTQSCYYAVL